MTFGNSMSDIVPSVKKSEKEPGETPDQLFDFLYRDPRRIDSLYAQFHDGLFAALQKKSGVTYEEQKQAKLNAAIAEGGLASKRGTAEERSETIQPHDTILLDLLSRLKSDGWIQADYETAKPGSFVLIEGTLFLADRYLLSLAEMGLDVAMRDAKAKGGMGRGDVKNYEMIRKMLPKMNMTSSFYLQTSTGRLVSGTIKEEGLDEPISAYYFKHGAGGIGNVRVLGFKEPSGDPNLVWNESQFFGAMRQVVGAFRDLLFTEDIRLTPITIFRLTERG